MLFIKYAIETLIERIYEERKDSYATIEDKQGNIITNLNLGKVDNKTFKLKDLVSLNQVNDRVCNSDFYNQDISDLSLCQVEEQIILTINNLYISNLVNEITDSLSNGDYVIDDFNKNFNLYLELSK